MSRFLTGINYWPRRSAMYMWERFDLGEIREDFARIHALGLDIVRFFLMWEAFQPAPDRIDPTMLARLDDVIGAVRDAGLRAMPTFFTGHMSGVNWIPSWALDPATDHGRFRTFAGGRESPYGIGNFYRSELLQAQRLHVRTVGERNRDNPGIFAWDLGNEFSNMREPDSPEEAAEWSHTLTYDLIDASHIPVTAGTHGEDITRDRNIRPSLLCAPYGFATMHGYTVYSAFARNRLDPCVVPFLSEVMQSCSGKPVLFSECGNPSAPPGMVSPFDRVPLPGEPQPPAAELPPHAAPYACLTEQEMPHYAYAIFDRLQRRGSLGAFWWCWADYADELAVEPPFDRAPHELRFGIIDNVGNEKPVARMLSVFAREDRRTIAPPPPFLDEATYYANFPKILDDEYRGYCTLYP
ncbi:MAG: glycoside hydrolase 5 family protein [Vulcanimicrobiaceae bacterium]